MRLNLIILIVLIIFIMAIMIANAIAHNFPIKREFTVDNQTYVMVNLETKTITFNNNDQVIHLESNDLRNVESPFEMEIGSSQHWFLPPCKFQNGETQYIFKSG